MNPLARELFPEVIKALAVLSQSVDAVRAL